jgi:alkanesulfonate monooxygenase SsuD/methylene tetrahydromethanopterin reductase-like flavin-dependent oxidoreductase (luciferase family)
MELGILSLSDIQKNLETGETATAGRRIDQAIAYATLADRLGLEVFALGEHHTPDYAVSSPAVVLAAIAARTSRIRLTSAVTVLPILDPVRVYQDFATVDLVSHGRVDITVGRSAFAEPFAIFGERLEDYDALFAEKLDLLLQVREHDHVTWSGRFRPALHDAPVIPRALQHPLPVWVGVGGSPESAERAGRLGLPMTLGYIGGSLRHLRQTVDIYRAAGEHAGHPEKLRVGLSTHFHAASTSDKAREVFPYYHEYLRPKTPRGRGWVVTEAQFALGGLKSRTHREDPRRASGAGPRPVLRPDRLGRPARRTRQGVHQSLRHRDRARRKERDRDNRRLQIWRVSGGGSVGRRELEVRTQVVVDG